MKKLCILFIFCIFASCNCIRQYDVYRNIEQQFPNSEIYHCDNYGKGYIFVVIDSIGVHYVRCTKFNSVKITHRQLLKKWQNQ
jgi:hypothetical protein